MPVTQTFTASRNATWAPILVYPYPGAALPLTDATIAMQLRLYAGADGAALLALANISFSDALQSGTEGGDDEVRILTLDLGEGFTPTQLAALPGLNTPEAGDDQSFAFDIRITYADGISEILSSGTFTVSPGVTK